MSDAPPRLAVVCSSQDGLARVEAAAAAMLARMPADLAARLARTVLVFALDQTQHAAFAQGLGGPRDAVTRLAEERCRQRDTDPAEALHIVVLALDARHRPQSVTWSLAHELGHVACGHTALTRGAAAALDDQALTELEREAEAFAAQYSGW